jgi:FkbH-like protein
MIETLPERAPGADVALPADALAAFAAFRAALKTRADVTWGEHCSECAYPACYAHCAFYTPRPDFDCRRFEAGFEPVAGAEGLHRVRFRKWGKLEAQGPTPAMPAKRAAQRARRAGRWAALIDAAPAPYMVKRSLSRRANAHAQARVAPGAQMRAEAFAVETFASRAQPFTLTILNTGLNTGEGGAHGGRLFQARFEAGPGYRRALFPIASIAAGVDLSAPFLVQIEPVGEAEGVEAIFGVCDFVTLKADTGVQAATQPASSSADAKPVKVVVWDLDETLWSGTLAEDGAAGVTLRPEALAAIRMLDERGVLQSIASKNDHAEAMAALNAFGIADYFLHPQIHWNPKSGSVAAVARALDLGLDSVVFIDDQPFERGEVMAAHPIVRTLAHTDVASLADHPWFDLPVTAESRKRRHLYRQEAERAVAYEAAGGDYAAFLRGSQIVLTLAPLQAADVERVFELSQRTNQLNFNGTKFARAEVERLMADPARAALTLRCADRFGDYGLIGFVVADLTAGRIEDFFMSCRVQRKRVEHAAFAWLAQRIEEKGAMKGRGAREMQVAFTATARNGAAIAMLDELGFAPLDAGERRRNIAAPFADADIVTVRAPTARGRARQKAAA